MTKRTKDSGFYDHPFIQKLPKDGKLLYDYLSFNSHVESSGLYKITIQSMAFETGIAIEDLPDLIGLLVPNIAWYPEDNIVWVKEFLSRQYRSSTFLVRVAKCLKDLGNHNNIIRDYLEYNKKYHGFEIPMPLNSDNTLTPAKKPLEPKLGPPSSELDPIIKQMIKTYEAAFKQQMTPPVLEALNDIRATYAEGWFDEAVEVAKRDKVRARVPIKYIATVLENRFRQESASRENKTGNELSDMEEL